MNANQKIAGAIGAGVLLISGALWFKPREAQASPHNTAPTISLVQAVQTVLTANPGTAAVDATLERENDRMVWEVELDNDLEVYVNASTNQIVKTEQNWDFADIPLLGEWMPN
ncbi:peptidase propeptide/YPEB domain protein [Leptolyngbya sp. NIES-3755]|nr:peptidase propeptide/YPEB domain protein [Leptolyngbya sp. NIES-3755]